MMKTAFIAAAGLVGVSTAQTCDNIDEYTVRPFARGLTLAAGLTHAWPGASSSVHPTRGGAPARPTDRGLGFRLLTVLGV